MRWSGEAATCPQPEVKVTLLGRLVFLLSIFLPGEENMFLAHLDYTRQMLTEVGFFPQKPTS